MKKLFNEDLIKILLSIILFIVAILINNETIKLIILILSYIVISYEMYIESFECIKEKDIFNENTLMIIATIGAFIIGSHTEAVLVILLFQIGEYLSDLAVDKSKDSITELLDLRVDKVTLENNKVIKIEEAKIDDIFIVKPGEKIPLDGIVVEGSSSIDTSSLTGESVPRTVKKDEEVLSGCINKDSILKIRVTKLQKDSTAQKIIDIIENSDNTKSNTEKFITRFARVYTPIVVLCALLIAVIPSIITKDYNTWIYRALVFLVTSCPCALVLSVPLGYFCGIGKASLEGIIVKSSEVLEKLSNIDYLMLDKTGTITEGVFEVNKIETEMDKDELLKIVASAEQNSIHPIAQAISNSYKKELYKVENYKEISGQGISCKIKNKEVLVGNYKLMDNNKIDYKQTTDIGTILYIAINKEYKGYILISDKIKESSKNISNLNKYIKQEILILSGDNENIVKDVASKVHIKAYYGDLLPIDKVNIVKEYKQKGNVMFIGDGINDAPVIKISDLGASLGGIGSDAAITASDIIFMKDDLSKLKEAICISNYTGKKVKQSIIFALTIKLLVLILSVFGISTILIAVFADVGVTLLSVLNVLLVFLKKY